MDDLCKLILQEKDLYTQMLGVLSRERESIVSSSVDELTVNNKEKDVLLLQIRLLDETCDNILEKLYRSLSGHNGTPSIANLLDLLEPEQSIPLRSGYSRLIDLARQVKEANRDNERMIKGSLRALRSSISFLLSCTQPGRPCYESTGQLKNGGISLSLFNKEA